MKIVIPGGSGQVGSCLARAFVDDGHDVVVLSRSPRPAPWRVVPWDGRQLGPWAAEFDGADAVINLTGRSVNCRYHASYRREIKESRIRSVQIVGQAIGQAQQPPAVWLQASTATIYADRYDAANDEATGILGVAPQHPDTWHFSYDVASSWERITNEAIVPETRKVLLRSAMVMTPDRGAVFDMLISLARNGLGGRIGDGRQYMSWIHEVDLYRSILWLIEHEDLSGPVNLASPNPVSQADFMTALRRADEIRIGLCATRWMLEIGTFLMRTESELILKSRRVVPRRMLDSGFQFQFPEWPAAATDLCQRWRQNTGRQTNRGKQAALVRIASNNDGLQQPRG